MALAAQQLIGIGLGVLVIIFLIILLLWCIYKMGDEEMSDSSIEETYTYAYKQGFSDGEQITVKVTGTKQGIFNYIKIQKRRRATNDKDGIK